MAISVTHSTYYSVLSAPNDSTTGNSNPETKIKCLAVDCENEEEIQKLIDKIQKSDELKEKIAHKEPKKRRPRCIIYNIQKDTASQDVIDRIELSTECDGNSVEFPHSNLKVKKRCQHWVVELPTPAFFTLEAAGKLMRSWSIYRIKEFFSVRRCFSCHNFGYLQRNYK
ncbi:hypothetical protein AVEN_163045-1 [Araneus ventricosus]|uniref:Uncharacterized protein n=1 Tax=Araneus ventricosus TaxID=182803 RepID=A0A4Y2J717_ARAVE|nr:hypothetical protein AVEN_163045-1 [Araneus ventricosus]